MLTRRSTLFVIFVLLTMALAGCAKNSATQPTVDPAAVQQENTQQQAAAMSGGQTSINQELGQDMLKLVVYHATKDATYLVGEAHVVPKNDHPAQTAIELLLAGTKNPELVSVIPNGTALRNIWVKDHIAYVDFNDKIVKNNTGGSTTEMLLVYAIVDTLTEFHDVQKVQILVEGKKTDTISGHMDIGEPLTRVEKFIKK
jgi:germination protein M